jgi:hypothetical protein
MIKNLVVHQQLGWLGKIKYCKIQINREEISYIQIKNKKDKKSSIEVY